MALKLGRRILLQFPFRNSASSTYAFEPFVSQPPGGTAVSGVVDQKSFIAMGGNLCLVPQFFYGLDAV